MCLYAICDQKTIHAHSIDSIAISHAQSDAEDVEGIPISHAQSDADV